MVLYTDKSKTSSLYKSLSLRFANRLAFAEIRSSASELIRAEGITAFPSLVVIRKDGRKVPYDGALSEFLYILLPIHLCWSVGGADCGHSARC